MTPFNPLSPAASPHSTPIPGTRQVNKKLIFGVAAAGATLFLGAVCYVAVTRGQPQSSSKKDEGHGSTATGYAQNLAGSKNGGQVAPKTTPTQVAYKQEPVAVLPPAAPASTPEDEYKKMRNAARLAALSSKPDALSSGYTKPESKLQPQQVAAIQKQDPNNAQNVLDELQRTQSLLTQQQNPEANSLNNFLGDKHRFELKSKRTQPKSPYVIETGTLIPALALIGVNSDLPGAVTAQVSQDVFDSPTGDVCLIPQGSKLFGQYVSTPNYGQSRIFVAWQRIIFPDGSTFDLGAMEGTDEQGMSGETGNVNNHYVRTFGSALALSLVTGGIGLTQGGNSNGAYGAPNFASTMSQAVGENLGNVVSELTRKNLSIPPTITIKPGARVGIMVSKDLYLPPWRTN